MYKVTVIVLLSLLSGGLTYLNFAYAEICQTCAITPINSSWEKPKTKPLPVLPNKIPYLPESIDSTWVWIEAHCSKDYLNCQIYPDENMMKESKIKYDAKRLLNKNGIDVRNMKTQHTAYDCILGCIPITRIFYLISTDHACEAEKIGFNLRTNVAKNC